MRSLEARVAVIGALEEAAAGAEDVGEEDEEVVGHVVVHASVLRDLVGVAEGAHDELAVDRAELAARGELEGVGGDAVDVAQAALGVLVDERDGVGGEDLAVASDVTQAVVEVLGGVAGGGLAEGEAGVDAGPEGAVLGEREPLGQADEAPLDLTAPAS